MSWRQRIQELTPDRWLRGAILVLLLGLLVFGPLAYGLVGEDHFAIVQWLVMAMTALWGIRIWIGGGEVRFRWPRCFWALAAFVILAVVRYFTADVEYLARSELFRILLYALVVLVVVHNCGHRLPVRWVVGTLVVLATGLSLYAIYQFVTESDLIWGQLRPSGYGRRGSGTFVNPNHFAGYLLLIMPLAFAFAAVSRRSPVTKAGFVYAGLIMLAGIGVTLSRGGYLATAVTLGIFFAAMLGLNLRKGPILAGFTILMIVIAAFVAQNQFAKMRFRNSMLAGQKADVRIALWGAAWEMWKDHPFVGVGPGHFDTRFRPYRPEEVQSRPVHVHNDWLNALVDWGIAGAGIIAVFFGLFYRDMFAIWRRLREAQGDFSTGQSDRLAFVLGAGTGLTGLLIHAFLDFHFQIPAIALTAFVLLALLAAHRRYLPGANGVAPGSGVRGGVTLVLLVLMAATGWQSVRWFRETTLLHRAWQPGLTHAENREWLLKAYEVERWNHEIPHLIGESLRLEAWEGDFDREQEIRSAIEWYDKARPLNPFNPFNDVRHAMCLHWLEEHEAARPYMERAMATDPNHSYIVAIYGWHFAQLGEFRRARIWLDRALWLDPRDPENIVRPYLDIVSRRLEDREQGLLP